MGWTMVSHSRWWAGPLFVQWLKINSIITLNLGRFNLGCLQSSVCIMLIMESRFLNNLIPNSEHLCLYFTTMQALSCGTAHHSLQPLTSHQSFYLMSLAMQSKRINPSLLSLYANTFALCNSLWFHKRKCQTI